MKRVRENPVKNNGCKILYIRSQICDVVVREEFPEQDAFYLFRVIAYTWNPVQDPTALVGSCLKASFISRRILCRILFKFLK